jgi:hypothetical protein
MKRLGPMSDGAKRIVRDALERSHAMVWGKSGGAHGQDAAAGVSGRLEMPATILSREKFAASDGATAEALRGSLGVPGTPAVPLGSSAGKEVAPAAASPAGASRSPREGDLSVTTAPRGRRAVDWLMQTLQVTRTPKARTPRSG